MQLSVRNLFARTALEIKKYQNSIARTAFRIKVVVVDGAAQGVKIQKNLFNFCFRKIAVHPQISTDLFVGTTFSGAIRGGKHTHPPGLEIACIKLDATENGVRPGVLGFVHWHSLINIGLVCDSQYRHWRISFICIGLTERFQKASKCC
jgi:hypothetical protein